MIKTFCDRCEKEVEAYMTRQYTYKKDGVTPTAVFTVSRDKGDLCSECMFKIIKESHP